MTDFLIYSKLTLVVLRKNHCSLTGVENIDTDNPKLDVAMQIDQAAGNGKVGGSMAAPASMCNRFLIDPSVKGDDAAEWEGMLACIRLLEGNVQEAERHARRNGRHWISAEILKRVKGKKAIDKASALAIWSGVSARLKSPLDKKPVVSLKEREKGSELVLA